MKRLNSGVIKRVVGFLESAFLRCFFGCFRIRDEHHRASRSLADSKDSLLPKETVDSALCLEGKISNAITQEDFCNQSSIEHETNDFNTCGVLSENPAQIQKSSKKLNFRVSGEDGISSLFQSWHSGGFAKLQHWDEPFDSVTSAEVYNSSDLPEKGYTCFDKECTQGMKLQFRSVEQVSGLEGKSMHMESSPLNTKSKIQTFGFIDSPHPTPVHLTDEMLTPATVCPIILESAKPGKHARIRTQYVYPVLKPVENVVQWKEHREAIPRHVQSVDWFEQQLKSTKGRDTVAKEKSPIALGLSPKLSETSFLSSGEKLIQVENFVSTRNSSLSNLTDGTEKLNLYAPEAIAASMSQLLKPKHLTNDAEGIDHMPKEPSQSPKSFDEDRPIIGTVAAHWNDIQSSHATPKWWDGNGIPNSTKKYKEDQKVSWHATPFEERLEKVLSDEKLLPHRKLQYRRPIEFEE